MEKSRYISLELDAHSNVYLPSAEKDKEIVRKIRTDLMLPENGTDQDTGVLILVTGYGASIDSRVFRKMQEEFSNLYNMVVIQCDYYGSKYMGKEILEDLYDELKGIEKFPEDVVLECEEKTGETQQEFNDMGIMQALDIVNATLSVICRTSVGV